VVEELTPFYGADCPVAVVVRASWPEERILRGTLADIAQQAEGIERTALILVGPGLGARISVRARSIPPTTAAGSAGA
jgi:precorrin-4/cobalt-precorrin-4 C11-methyltransferase